MVGSLSTPSGKGGEIVTVYEALSLMLTFGLLIVAVLSFHKKK
ncbi:putative holin-like toxin [Brevibacillus gelatini]